MVIDWHNFGYTILQLNLKPKHPLVHIARVYERFFGRRADRHLCVTHAMARWLQSNWGITADVVHDKAPAFFRRLDVPDRHELFYRLRPQFPPVPKMRAQEATQFTGVVDGKVVTHPYRPALLVSSTSWTPDEDFGLLFSALVAYDKHVSALPRGGHSFPSVMVVVTGKGPQRAMYEARLKDMDMTYVTVLTMWLEAGDYPKLLGSADLGVCLHTSSSGLDLPMKVVDMYGCHLPVCAVGFPCLDELVQHDKNGLVFESAEELAEQLLLVLDGFPNNRTLDRLRQGVVDAESDGWQANWTANASKVFLDAALR